MRPNFVFTFSLAKAIIIYSYTIYIAYILVYIYCKNTAICIHCHSNVKVSNTSAKYMRIPKQEKNICCNTRVISIKIIFIGVKMHSRSLRHNLCIIYYQHDDK